MIGLTIISRLLYTVILGLLLSISLNAQTTNDSTETKRWNFHYQNTNIYQYHPSFKAKYSGVNSLNPKDEANTSITGTMYFGVRLWKGLSAYYNQEISGGSGFSETRGIAGFPNGEVYRVSDALPKIYIARLYIRQVFGMSEDYQKVEDGINQLSDYLPTSYLAITAGKFSILDFFDDNKFSHDPRTQFFNWALMGNGSWDYPANTRGYIYGIVTELVKPKWAFRFATVMVPITANGAVMDKNIFRSHSEALQVEYKYNFGNQSGIIRLLTFLTEARMGNYIKSIEWGLENHIAPVIDSTNTLGRTKYGFGINVEHNFNKEVGAFFRASWNDGHNETWEFTEIDRAISSGFQLSGNIWNRTNDKLGLALLVNGLSNDHRNYLKAGGYGFIIGDGNLNYQPEMIAELYYSYKLKDYPLWITPDYQFILNPAYNKDRGPVHAFGIRVHIEI